MMLQQSHRRKWYTKLFVPSNTWVCMAVEGVFTHTHIHTHVLSLSFSISLSSCASFSLSLSLSLSFSFSFSLSLSLSRSLALSFSLSLSVSLFLFRFLSFSSSLSLSLLPCSSRTGASDTPSSSCSQIYEHVGQQRLSARTHARARTHTHTHTHTYRIPASNEGCPPATHEWIHTNTHEYTWIHMHRQTESTARGRQRTQDKQGQSRHHHLLCHQLFILARNPSLHTCVHKHIYEYTCVYTGKNILTLEKKMSH